MTWRPFEEARKFTHSLKLNGKTEWEVYRKSDKKPSDMPTNPQQVYKKEWIDWGDFLGTDNRSFEDARKFVRKLGLKNRKDWGQYCKSGKKPDDIPNRPDAHYEKEWKGYVDFFGTEPRSFKEARKFVHSLKFKGKTEWRQYCTSGKKPDDIPSQPQMVYKKEWEGYGDWFGTGTIAIQVRSANYLPWPEAKIVYRRLAKKYGIKHDAQFVKFAQTHKKLFADLRIPIRPRDAYSKEMVWKRMKK